MVPIPAVYEAAQDGFPESGQGRAEVGRREHEEVLHRRHLRRPLAGLAQVFADDQAPSAVDDDVEGVRRLRHLLVPQRPDEGVAEILERHLIVHRKVVAEKDRRHLEALAAEPRRQRLERSGVVAPAVQNHHRIGFHCWMGLLSTFLPAAQPGLPASDSPGCQNLATQKTTYF